MSDIEGRWLIEGGIDQPLTDTGPAACDPPAPDQKVLKLDMYVMGKCPWCATALENIAGKIACDFSCEHDGEVLSARLDFNVHMVGLNNGTYDAPSLQTVHGPSELVGERLELCARQHYARGYQFVRFLSCMDRNVTTVPLRAPDCAREAEMDLDLLVACANQDGERLVAGSYGYSSWMGIKSTPSFVINGKKKITGLPANFSHELCSHIKLTSTVLRAGAGAAAAEEEEEDSSHQSLAEMAGPHRASSWASSWARHREDGHGAESRAASSWGGGVAGASVVEGVGYWVPLSLGVVALPGLAAMVFMGRNRRRACNALTGVGSAEGSMGERSHLLP